MQLHIDETVGFGLKQQESTVAKGGNADYKHVLLSFHTNLNRIYDSLRPTMFSKVFSLKGLQTS